MASGWCEASPWALPWVESSETMLSPRTGRVGEDFQSVAAMSIRWGQLCRVILFEGMQYLSSSVSGARGRRILQKKFRLSNGRGRGRSRNKGSRAQEG